MKRYILSSAVVTTPGLYNYELIDIDEAIEWLNKGKFESTVGYEQTAEALSMLVDMPIAYNRKQIRMEDGDEALVFRLTCRLDDPALKSSVALDFIINNCEIGLLTKLGYIKEAK